MKNVLLAIVMLGGINPVAASTPFAFTCTPAAEMDMQSFLLELLVEQPVGAITYKETERDERLITWQTVGNSTVIMDGASGYVIMAFDSDTWQGWMPFEPGSVLEVSCRPGSE